MENQLNLAQTDLNEVIKERDSLQQQQFNSNRSNKNKKSGENTEMIIKQLSEEIVKFQTKNQEQEKYI